MKPLKPDDLLIRHTPVEHNRWVDGSANNNSRSKPVRLERFQELEQTLRNNPVQSEPYMELARIYLHKERWVDAKRVLDRAADLFTEEEEVLFLREEAQLARSLQLLSAAEAEYQRVRDPVTEKELARAKLDLNAMRERVCRSRLARHPDQLELTIPLAEALSGLDRSEEALDYLNAACADPELRASASLKLGEIHEAAGRVPDALSCYRRAALFRVPPPSPSVRLAALTRAAELAVAHKMCDSAIRYAAMLREIEPLNPRWQQIETEVRELESAIEP